MAALRATKTFEEFVLLLLGIYVFFDCNTGTNYLYRPLYCVFPGWGFTYFALLSYLLSA